MGESASEGSRSEGSEFCIDENLYRVQSIYMVAPVDMTLRALADPTRREIVTRLARGAATVGELVECFDLTQPTVSSHLKTLEKCGLISRTRVAQTRPCKLEPAGLQALGYWLGELRTAYEEHYARLDTVLDKLRAEEKEKP